MEERRQHIGYPLAVRIEVVGQCRFHESLRAEPDRWTNEFRAAAIEVAPDDVWVEKVRYRTTNSTSGVALGDGPVADIVNYVAALPADPAELYAVLEELADLKRKLPYEVTAELGDLTNPSNELVAEWLESAKAIILQQIGAQKTE